MWFCHSCSSLISALVYKVKKLFFYVFWTENYRKITCAFSQQTGLTHSFSPDSPQCGGKYKLCCKVRLSKTLFFYLPNIPATSIAQIAIKDASRSNKWKFCYHHLDLQRNKKWLRHCQSEKRNTAKHFRSNMKSKKVQLIAHSYFEDKSDRIQRGHHIHNSNATILRKLFFVKTNPYYFFWNVSNDLIGPSFGTYHTEISVMLILKWPCFLSCHIAPLRKICIEDKSSGFEQKRRATSVYSSTSNLQ